MFLIGRGGYLLTGSFLKHKIKFVQPYVVYTLQVLGAGPECMWYYYTSLSLIIISLTLQVIVGLLTIYTTHLSNYYQRFSGNVCEDLFTNLCCCKVVPKPQDERLNVQGLIFIYLMLHGMTGFL